VGLKGAQGADVAFVTERGDLKLCIYKEKRKEGKEEKGGRIKRDRIKNGPNKKKIEI